MKQTLSLLNKTSLQGAARGYSPRRLVLPLLLIGGVVLFVVLALSHQGPQPPQPPQQQLNQAPSYVQIYQDARLESIQVESLNVSWHGNVCRELNKPLAEAWRSKLPKRLLMTAAVGYDFEKLRGLTNSFLHAANGVLNATERLGLVFFVKDVPEDWPIVDDRIFFVRAAFNAGEKGADQSIARTRFIQYNCFMEAMGLQNDTRIFTMDARDSVVQQDPFVYSEDDRLRFFYESGTIKDVWCNFVWLESCSSREFAENFCGTRIVNAGTMYGTAGLLSRYFAWFSEKLFADARCNDQGLHMYGVLSGELRGVAKFRMEDNEWGRVLTGHAANQLVYLNNKGEMCSKVTGSPYTIAHQYDRIDHVNGSVTRRFWLPPRGTQLLRKLAPMPTD